MNKRLKFVAAFSALVLGGCDGTKAVGSIECDDSKIDVMSIKNEFNLANGQTWSIGIAYGGVTSKVHRDYYPGHLPASFKRQTTGNPKPDYGVFPGFPYNDAFQFYLGDFPSDEREKITQCLVKNDSKLRSLLRKTKRLKQFPPPGRTFDTRFVFWDATLPELELRFDAAGSSEGEYLLVSNVGMVFYIKDGKQQMIKVGQLKWDENDKLVGIQIDIQPRKKVTPIETDPAKFKRRGKSMMEYFSVPFTAWTPKY